MYFVIPYRRATRTQFERSWLEHPWQRSAAARRRNYDDTSPKADFIPTLLKSQSPWRQSGDKHRLVRASHWRERQISITRSSPSSGRRRRGGRLTCCVLRRSCQFSFSLCARAVSTAFLPVGRILSLIRGHSRGAVREGRSLRSPAEIIAHGVQPRSQYIIGMCFLASKLERRRIRSSPNPCGLPDRPLAACASSAGQASSSPDRLGSRA